MNRPLVHVLVLNWNGLEHLSECFNSLRQTTYTNARFILIDNASTDDSVPYVRETCINDPRVEIIENPTNLGWSGGNNVGIVRALDAGADYVFLLNNDTVTATNAIDELVRMAEANQNVGALAPKMLLYDNPALVNSVGIECSIIGNGWDLGLGRLDAPKWNVKRQVAGVCGGAAFLRSKALRAAGLLPEDFEIYLDDLDLSLRLWNAGYEILSCPEAVVRHKFSATMGQGRHERRKYYLNTRNRFRMILRNFPVGQAFRVVAALLLGETRAAGRAVLDRELWRVAAHMRAWCAAALFAPGDLAARRTQTLTPDKHSRFWPLIRTDQLFFPGVDFPEDGWYLPRTVHGAEYRPISSHAFLEVNTGKLRLAFVNCYPEFGCMEVDVSNNGKPIVSLPSLNQGDVVIEVEEGALEFRANRIFDADDTGEHTDFGGWIRVESIA
jgi:GT2 family glycosyltransferase